MLRLQSFYSCCQLRPDVWGNRSGAEQELSLLGCVKLELKTLLASICAMQLGCTLILSGDMRVPHSLALERSEDSDSSIYLCRHTAIVGMGCGSSHESNCDIDTRVRWDWKEFRGMRFRGILPSAGQEGSCIYLGSQAGCQDEVSNSIWYHRHNLQCLRFRHGCCRRTS